MAVLKNGVMAGERATLRRVIREAGGVTAFSKRLGMSREIIYRWLRSGRVPADRVPAVIKAADGRCTAAQLRPDMVQTFAADAKDWE